MFFVYEIQFYFYFFIFKLYIRDQPFIVNVASSLFSDVVVMFRLPDQILVQTTQSVLKCDTPPPTLSLISDVMFFSITVVLHKQCLAGNTGTGKAILHNRDKADEFLISS